MRRGSRPAARTRTETLPGGGGAPGKLWSGPMTPEPTADFGFRTVPADEKKTLVRAVFDRVAERYDLMNDLMSGGIHRLWKAALIDWLNPRPGQHLLDVAGGTGDVAFRFLERTRPRRPAAGDVPPATRVTVCDINDTMVSVGRDRAIDRGLLGGIDWVCGDAEALPIASGTVDCYTIAFGLRNVTRIDAALCEARRVLRPGGRFLCLEFSRVAVPGLAKPYDLYSFEVLPRLGGWVAGDAEAYRYLAESIRRFPPQDELARRLEQAGLARVKYRNLTGGIAALHSGWRL
jgi:demethylmenaquinone methyltransferase/2-methoxy-6-polyprenyl-1,4-benzoquinol methylase